MKNVLAISGGVDSVVLLDMVAREEVTGLNLQDCVVAHFDHGIRAESGGDAEFVRHLAEKYGLEFFVKRANLGKNASEELARSKRYEFLRAVAAGGKIITAHHQDDLIETVLINLIRGTGWRGLAPFWSDDVLRPLLDKSKAEIVAYAIKNNLKWVEDQTNYQPKYLRNRVRDIVTRLTGQQRQRLVNLYKKQVKLRAEIEQILIDNNNYYHLANSEQLSTNQLAKLPENVALEILRKTTHEKLTMPQLKRLLKTLKTAKSGDLIQPGGGLRAGIYKGQITVSSLV
ncbi:MAG: tRNA lysidine(34) synthetase TilS [Candidatus Nomurabacteria bacterium]|jgi:tRNA(Ile)-lysidine synthase|nr:tRNA lysidine(34) synthetase TilS [Candidatus Nomurabacteria bacterium]